MVVEEEGQRLQAGMEGQQVKSIKEHNKEQLEQRPPAGVRCGEKGCSTELRFLREDGDSLLRTVICPVCLTIKSMYFAPPNGKKPDMKK